MWSLYLTGCNVANVVVARLYRSLSIEPAAAIEPAAVEQSQPRDELELYFALPDAPLNTDPLEWWPRHGKSLPSLSRMARQFLGVPASLLP